MAVEYVLTPFPKQLNGKIEFNKKKEEKHHKIESGGE